MNKWHKRFLHIAEEVAKWSKCLHHQIGCVLVKDKHIIATGYNGAPSGMKSCSKQCFKEQFGITTGSAYCLAVHAEQNALAQAAKFGQSTKDTILYCTHLPCSICLKMLINAGIKEIYYKYDYNDTFTTLLLPNIKIKIYKLGEINEV